MSEHEESTERALAADLLSIGAVTFRPARPFTWASGLRSPVYCDNRLTISHPSVRRRITDGFVHVIAEKNYAADVIAGTATAGIPHAAWLADRLERPMVYVRSSAKSHGTGRRTEGHLEPGCRVVLVEDLVSTGGSSLEAAQALESEGAVIEAVLAIFTYGLAVARSAFERAGLPLHALTSFDALMNVALETNRISIEDAESVAAWGRDPERWSQQFPA